MKTELQNAINHYQSLIDDQAYDQACEYFREQIEAPTLLGIGQPCLRRTGLLECLFPDGCDNVPLWKKLRTVFLHYRHSPIAIT
ncbi:hypothetical protein [Oceanicoccus sagamiensis]|uniref:Uncharacterized protein n=1 Tax=Oceanicoccus sagamiensis TaxID=716816 RepID=A0A1X9N7G0_9GAMM|nr:hypothetical protein [Oceanicoccus sagamiensis]ARN73131.1 hypothetical protein BST96_02820 [Oceanicoccus sagamiensis]